MYLYAKKYVYVISCKGVWGGGFPLHGYTHDGHLIHVDQIMAQLLIKFSIFGGSVALCLLYYRHKKIAYA